MKTVALLSYAVTSSQRKHNPKSVIDVTLLFEPRRPDLLAVGWGRYSGSRDAATLSAGRRPAGSLLHPAHRPACMTIDGL